MNGTLLVLIILVVVAIGVAVYASSKASGRRSASSLADAKADARRVVERLGGQVLNLTGSDEASKQAMADASERYTAASSQIDQALPFGSITSHSQLDVSSREELRAALAVPCCRDHQDSRPDSAVGCGRPGRLKRCGCSWPARRA